MEYSAFRSERVANPVVPFATFQPLAAIDLPKNAFAAGGTFTLGAASNGIAPLTEAVQLQVGTFSATLPGGSFKPFFGVFQFKGVVNGASLIIIIQSLGGHKYAFAAVGWNSNLTGTANPVTARLAIGDDAGSAAVTAFFGTVPHGSL